MWYLDVHGMYVSSLPMRDGNKVTLDDSINRMTSFEPTYEGWKQSLSLTTTSTGSLFRAYL